MVDRIRDLLAARQLSSTQFADTIGVARPIISHILSGRNKPSLEVVQKIVAAFPDVSVPWLLTGAGPMLSSDAAAPERPMTTRVRAVRQPERALVAPAAPAASPPADTAAAPAPVEPASHPGPVAEPSAPELPPAPASPPAAVAPSSGSAAAATSIPSTDSIALAQGLAEPGKSIKRIVIFYTDGTFTAYQPE